jgi:4-hydroxybutyrate CoA-transferase
LTTAEEAVSVVGPGHRVMIPVGSNPFLLADALAARLAADLAGAAGVEISHCAPGGAYAWFEPGYPGVSRVVHEHYGGPAVRRWQRQGAHDYLPMPLGARHKARLEAETRTSAEQRPIDVVLVQVSPPDEHGYVSLGGMVWNQERHIEAATYALAEVSAHVPRCYGQNLIHASRFHAFVENDSPRYMSTVIEPTETERRIAAYVAEVLRDGDTIQVGAGGITTAIIYAGAFDEKRDLGWHSETTIGRTIDLIRDGVFTGERKSIDRGVAVGTGFAGTAEQIAYIRMNPRIKAMPVEYTHNLAIIAGQDNMVAINAALAIDLSGQSTAEALGHELVSGTGGQTEFVVGALSARNGRSITLLESTALDGSLSTIMAELPPGTAVTVPRIYSDIVITEHGIARLWGRTLRERARELITIAHPRFREELERQAREVCGL